MKKCLLIGCGNTLRRDDGLGPYIVENMRGEVEQYGMDIQFLAMPQLDIILASQMSKVELVIFVDARVDDSEELVKSESIKPVPGLLVPFHTSHTLTMSMLLRIVQDWYGATPLCHAVMPKGYEFDLSETISDKAQLVVEKTKDRIKEILVQHT